MPRRQHRPSQYRFLAGTGLGLLALVVHFSLSMMETAVCRIGRAPEGCSVFPNWMMTLPLIVCMGGILFSAYRFYADFHRGDYYKDLAEAGYF